MRTASLSDLFVSPTNTQLEIIDFIRRDSTVAFRERPDWSTPSTVAQATN